MASRTLTLDRFRLAGLGQSPPTFWDGLSASDRELSVNVGESRPFGADTAWDVAGPVRQHWNNEVHPFATYICQRDKKEIFAGVDWEGKFSLVVFMIGTTWSNSKPTLVIRIIDRKVIGRLGNRLRKEGRFRRSGFRVVGQQGDLVFKAGSEKEALSSTTTQLVDLQQRNPSQSLFGESILIRTSDDLSRADPRKDERLHERIATMGAVIQIGDRIFGLTAAHTLFQDLPQSTSLERRDGAVAPGVHEIYHDGFFDFFDDNDNPELPADKLMQLTPNLPPVQSSLTPHSIFLALPYSFSSTTREVDTTSVKSSETSIHIGEFLGWSAPSESHQSLVVAEQHANPDLDWALIKLQGDKSFDLVNKPDTRDLDIVTSKVAQSVPMGEVLVASKVAQYRRTHCSGTLALISLPGSSELQRVYTIRSSFSDSRSVLDVSPAQGESGSLVVDPYSGDAYGLVVAESCGLDLTYMIPVQDIFEDITRKWNGHLVRFPTESSGSTVHPYLPVPRGNIRLFILDPGLDDDPIKGSLVHSLFGAREYDFVSYSWDSNALTQSIIVDGRKSLIPATLKDFLKRFRSEDGPRTLWADALCMNMHDSSEGRQPLSQWPLIISGAAHVCVWLGNEDKGTVHAFDLINRLPQNFDTVWDWPDLEEHFQALRSLAKRSWFSRRWIVQEIAYARNARVCCGSYQVDWTKFANCITFFAAMVKEGSTTDFTHLPANQLVLLCGSWLRKSDEGQLRERLLPLDSMVCMFTDFKAMDPRDTIYALLSVAKDTRWPTSAEMSSLLFQKAVLAIQRRVLEGRRSKGETSSMLGVTRGSALVAREFINLLRIEALTSSDQSYQDTHKLPVARPAQVALENRVETTFPRATEIHYDRSFAETAMDFVLYTISTSKSVDVICRAWAPVSEEHHLPSWIKSLQHAEFGIDPLGDPVRLNAEPLTSLRGLERQRYSAGGSFQTMPKKLGSTLIIKGSTLGTVSRVELPAALGNIPWEWLELGGWKEPDEPFPAHLWRTLVADRGIDGENAPLWYKLAWEHGFSRSIKRGDINIERLLSDRPTLFSQFWTRVQRVIWSRRLMMTSSGSLGLAPKASRVGDLICVLHGCTVPVILRERYETSSLVGSFFELVGECFVSGIMDGEAARLNCPEREFVLV